MWVRKRIDIRWSDIAVGLVRCLLPDRLIPNARVSLEAQLANVWRTDAPLLPVLSVRTGFDLLLDNVVWTEGSEVMFSAATIPDMPRIARRHRFTPIPIDVERGSLAPKIDSVQAALTLKTRAIVVAHLFGTRVPMAPILKFARRHDLMVIEDCAQAYAADGYTGHPESDVAMFSFGSIKTTTALGGGLLRISDPTLRASLQAAERNYKVQLTFKYAIRLLKYAGIRLISNRRSLATIHSLFRSTGQDYDAFANSLSRGFAGAGFFDRIRQRPSTAMLSVLLRRLNERTDYRIAVRVRNGEHLRRALRKHVLIPGEKTAIRTHWVFPIVIPDPQKLLKVLRSHGFDATQGGSMQTLQPMRAGETNHPVEADAMMRNIVYLPCYAEMPTTELDRMAKLVVQVATSDLEARESTIDVPTRRRSQAETTRTA